MLPPFWKGLHVLAPETQKRHGNVAPVESTPGGDRYQEQKPEMRRCQAPVEMRQARASGLSDVSGQSPADRARARLFFFSCLRGASCEGICYDPRSLVGTQAAW